MAQVIDSFFMQLNDDDSIRFVFRPERKVESSIVAVLYHTKILNFNMEGSPANSPSRESNVKIEMSKLDEICITKNGENVPMPLKGSIAALRHAFQQIKDACLNKKNSSTILGTRLVIRVDL